MSRTDIMVRLNMQLPKSVPKARSGNLTRAAELMPVTSSGAEVTAARKIIPIHIPPSRVFWAIASP